MGLLLTRRQVAPAAFVLSFMALGWAACVPEPEAGPRWNVLLVTFDTTRADRIGCYGNERIQTPTLDGLAADGIRFARALAAVPITAPSHSTVHTGRYPIAHGVRDNGLFVLADEQLTLAEILSAEGYATAAAIGAYPLTARFGLDQGFDLYDDHLTGGVENYLGERVVPKERLFFDERRAAQVNEAILPWLSKHVETEPERPFFTWVHYFDPHQPFEPAPPYDQLYVDRPYDGEIAYADSRLGFLLEHLKNLGELDNTLVIMTADHGEGLGEHGELTHAVLAYNSTLHVPLIVRLPAGAGPKDLVVDDWVGTVDVLPTVLELLGIDKPETVQGRSLVPYWSAAETPPAPRRRYAENLSTRLSHSWGELRILFDGPLKYIHGPRPELYDLDADPKELNDLIAERPADAARMREVLEQFLARNAVVGAGSVQPLDEEVRKRLESLGYLHSSGGGELTVSETLLDDGIPPQDRVGDVNDLSAAKHLLFDGRLADALQYTTKLTKSSPENPLYHDLHTGALVGLGRLDEAWSSMEKLLELGAPNELLMWRLASATFDRGERDRAVGAMERFLDVTPSARGWWLMYSFRSRLGDTEAGHKALETALEVDPTFAPARVDLGVYWARNGRPEVAELELRRAVEDAPYYAKGFYNYGTFNLHQGNLEDAAELFRRAVALAPSYLDARLALVATYVDLGSTTEAQRAFGELEKLAPDSRQAETARELLADEAPPGS